MRLPEICKHGASVTLRGSLRYDNYFELRIAARFCRLLAVGAPTRRCRFANPKR